MSDITTEKKLLMQLSVKLLKLGYEVESKRNYLRKFQVDGISEDTYEDAAEVFRALDEFNIATMRYKEIEKEYLEIRASIFAEE